CAASPDGQLIASLSSPEILIRSTATLEIIHAIKLPSELAAATIQTFLWSPSSTRILLSTPDQIQVFPALETLRSRAAIRNAVPKHSHIQFGRSDSEILVFSAFGLKLLIIDLSSSRAVEVASPKFYQRTSVPRTVSFRPNSGHMALLTRVAGRDLVSIHSPAGRQLQRSWAPETVDAQALAWSPDGQVLLVWESPAHGWHLLLYTPDGQLIRKLEGPDGKADDDSALKPGIRACQPSPSAQCYAVSDYSRSVSILDSMSWRQTLRLVHPITICPSDTLQVWQEQLSSTGISQFHHATQEISPATSMTSTGCSTMAFDASSNLLATKLDDSPTTLWIWDLSAGELRAVLLFYHPLEFTWHPFIQELLLV
ncbi:WD40 domain protein, partial [Geosmithia morbida]